MSEQVKKMLLNLFAGLVLTAVPGSVVMYATTVKQEEKFNSHEQRFKAIDQSITELKQDQKEARQKHSRFVEDYYKSQLHKKHNGSSP